MASPLWLRDVVKEDWTKLLTEEIAFGTPTGYESTAEIAAKIGVTKRNAYRRLLALREKGQVTSLYASINGNKTCVWRFEKKKTQA